jgi:hypothetical protein
VAQHQISQLNDSPPNQRLERPGQCGHSRGALPNWQCFLACADEASAVPIAEYLRLHDCPALVFPIPGSCDLMPTAEVRVPAEFLLRARHIWTRADTLTASPTGSLSIWRRGNSPEPHLTRSNRMTPPNSRWRGPA